MQLKDYIKQSSRTASGGFNRNDFPTDFSLIREMVAFDSTATMADALKRNLYYGDELKARVTKHSNRVKEKFDLLDKNLEVELGSVNKNHIHAALGIMSEAGELFEEYTNASLEGRELNRINLVEEAGDIMWYLAMLLRELDISFEEVAEKNISKLKARFPDKFTEEKAINRNIDLEEKALKEG